MHQDWALPFVALKGDNRSRSCRRHEILITSMCYHPKYLRGLTARQPVSSCLLGIVAVVNGLLLFVRVSHHQHVVDGNVAKLASECAAFLVRAEACRLLQYRWIDFHCCARRRIVFSSECSEAWPLTPEPPGAALVHKSLVAIGAFQEPGDEIHKETPQMPHFCGWRVLQQKVGLWRGVVKEVAGGMVVLNTSGRMEAAQTEIAELDDSQLLIN
jgi:hypothetical protein